MEVMEVPEPPPPGPGEVTVHPDAVGICGSDFHFFSGELQIFDSSPYPRVQGHEFSGIVEEVGPETGRVAVGDRVSVMPISWCGDCYACRVGRGNVCDNFSLVGIHTDGGLQEKLRVPESQVFPISAEPAVAALAEPFSIGARTVNRSGVREGERVVVLGAGPIGQTVHLLARDRGASTLLVDRVQSRLDLGRATGADSLLWEDRDRVVEACREWAGGEGPPLVIDATGVPDPIRAAVDMVASAGRVIVVGMSGEEVPLRIGTFTEKELDLLGVSCCGPEEFAEAVRFVEENQELLEPLISRRFSLERAPEALAFAMENPAEVMKVVITSGNGT
ncbi:MAG TPA: alcohol dehydrogenase catalytic domain-containing protein [Solirubrobacterales bacterium]|jgi:L-gulonate 5-dehydrogenase